MGYSQIYVRINDIFGRKFLLARSFDYNFQERMVSRARGIIEWLDSNKEYAEILTHSNHLNELERIIEVNWDYHDVNISTDIIKDYISNPHKSFQKIVFDNQDSKDGQLFIDFQVDARRKTPKGDPKCVIKYGFLMNFKDNHTVFDADEFMQQAYNPDVEDYNYREWRTRPFFAHCLKFTERNINYINKRAKKMTEEDALEFMECDYIKDLGIYHKA